MSARTRVVLASLALLAGCGTRQPAAPIAPVKSQPTAPAPPDGEGFRATRPKALAGAELSYPVPRLWSLDTGLNVYFLRRPSRVVSLSLVVRHGASSVPAGKSGLAGLTARMLTEGTRRKPSAALAEAVESLGTTLEAGAGRDESSVGLTVLPADLSRALELLAEVVTTPAFAPAELDRVRAEWLDGLRAERQNPQRLAALAAVRKLFGPTFGAPVNGSLTDIQRLTVADLRAFHQRAYTPDNAALVVVGDLEETLLASEARRLFAPFVGKSAVPAAPAVQADSPAKTRVLLVDRPGAVQSAIAAVQTFPKRSEPGHEARELMGRALGGLFTSRLNTNLREKHAFTYGAVARPVATRHFGTLLVSTSVRTDVTARALDEIRKELRLARDPSLGAPFTADELGRARSDLTFTLGATLEHPNRIADVVGSVFVEGLAPDYYARYAGLVAAIGAPEVAAEARALQPEQLLIVVVGDKGKIQAELEQAGYIVEPAPAALLE
jgi:zinc protease